MFQLDIFGNPEPLSIYLVRPDMSVLGCIDDIIDETVSSLSLWVNQQHTIDLSVVHIKGAVDWYDYIHEGMYIFVEKVGLFKINAPNITIDGVKEIKEFTANSCESELEDKTCLLSINMGLKTSMEYLVTYDDDETEALVNPYTGVPYDWIVLYNMFPEQLTEFKTKINNGYFGSPNNDGDIVITNSEKVEELTELFNTIPRIKNKIVMSDNVDGSQDSTLVEYVTVGYDGSTSVINSYTLTSQIVSRIESLITFYTKYRNQLSLLSIVLENTSGGWDVGDIYGVSDGDYTVANLKYQFEIDENLYSFLTSTLAKTIKCMVGFDIINRKINVTPVDHVGNNTGIVIGYSTLVNTLGIEPDEERLATRLAVKGGDDLEIARVNFGSNYVEDLSYKMNVVGPGGNRIYVSDDLAEKYATYLTYREQQRDRYIELSKQYESYAEQISEINNRVPNDMLKTDYSTFTLEELKGLLTQYKNLLVTLESLYKEDYGDVGLEQDGSIDESYIEQTEYWWDYVAYKSIIDEIQCAIDVFPYYNDTSKWTSAQLTEYEAKIKAWETEWSLYGVNELQAKIETYRQNMDLLAEESVIRVSADSYTIKTWAQLSTSQKAEYGNSELLYKYNTYMEYYNNMQSAQTYLNTLLQQVADLEEDMADVQEERLSIVENVSFDEYFTEQECDVIYRLFRDSVYTNENILSTSIDSSSDKIDRMKELLDDAKTQASISSRPQLKFNIEADNLLGLPEYSPLWDSFIPGNYMLVQYLDNTYVKLRMLGYTFNPRLPSSTDLQIEFSNFIRANNYYRDWATLLGDGGSYSPGSVGSSGGSGSGSSGNYGEPDDIDITISNTMLAKLLNSELFGTRVTNVILDTIQANVLTAKRATFGGFAEGTTKVNGKCIQTGYIVDANYNGTNGGINNTAGTIINLENGKFSFGGGKMVYDGTSLSVIGAITATTLATGNRTSSATGNTGTYISSTGAIYVGDKNQTTISAAGKITTKNILIYGSDTNSSCSIGDELVFTHSDYGTDSRLARFREYFDTIDGTDIFNVFSIYGNQIAFTQTNNGTWYLVYQGAQSAQITGNLTIDGTFTTYATSYFGRNISLGFDNDGIAGIRAGSMDANIISLNTDSSNNEIVYVGGKQASESGISGVNVRGEVLRLYSYTSGAVYLGASGSTAVTSDETLKDLSELDDRYIDFFNRLEPVAYKYKVGHRIHAGFGAQSVEKALHDSGLSTEDFAGLIIDEDINIGEDEVISPDGATHFDKLYSLRYEEFIPLNTMMIKRLQDEVESLKRQISRLEGK